MVRGEHAKRNAGRPPGGSGPAAGHVVPQTCMSGLLSSNRLPLPRTQDKVDMAVHWQLNVERRNQIELFCATFSSFTLTSMQELVFMRRSNPPTKTTVNIWHNWVWTVSSGHERVAWGRGGERHTRVGSGWRYRGCPVAQCSLPCAASGCPHLYLARPVRCPPPAPRE